MLEIDIPGRGKLTIENIVFDYNGTLAVDGVLTQETKDFLIKIQDYVEVHILTADTYGTVLKECHNLGVILQTFPYENAGIQKKRIIEELGKEKTIAIGNGYNDIMMLEESILSIAVMGKEGCSGKLLMTADIVVNSIEDVFTMLLKPSRIKATLRN
ncbi:ATPase, P-type (transporting), HAD superfamily, subfamily IC [Natronincola peptidivorans]|uniref:ATPase, P-type (Transporting), HAD superfamily, subfamily IC n=1 Tax=Natronincola peptidivorans TaxID=426128 RepID=A0A1I0DX48_9FIRM|nr:HAD hydrolase family protein [Natronincola peptidivorans]SET36610.1 ATPase, P-type (transporting), HAD superfamily, subfamily IC [Natronincola peptidivorans]